MNLDLPEKKVYEILDYIARNWERTIPGDKPRHPLPQSEPCPHPYTTPSFDGALQYPFYWDTYFSNVGLYQQGRADLALSNIEALTYYLHQVGWVPNINFKDGMNRSQPPFLSMMVRDYFEHTGDREWLARKEHALKWEYLFWMTERVTPTGLNRFHHNASEAEMIAFFDDCLVPRVGVSASSREEKLEIAAHYFAEAESGADFTSRFEGVCAHFAAIELNCNLYHGLPLWPGRGGRALGKESRPSRGTHPEILLERRTARLLRLQLRHRAQHPHPLPRRLLRPVEGLGHLRAGRDHARAAGRPGARTRPRRHG